MGVFRWFFIGCLNGVGVIGVIERLFNSLDFGVWMGLGFVGFFCVIFGEVVEVVLFIIFERVLGFNCF